MMDMSKLMSIFNSENGLKNVMLETAFQDEESGHEFSQAALVADVVNVMRMDTKRMAEAHGVDVEIEQMTPERAAELLQGMVKGNDDFDTVIEIFDEIENQRMAILADVEGEEALDDYMEMKQSILYSVADETEVEVPTETEE